MRQVGRIIWCMGKERSKRELWVKVVMVVLVEELGGWSR